MHSTADVKVVTQEDVMMAAIRLITAAAQHCETQKLTKESKPTEAEHVRFVTAAAQDE